MFTQEPVLVAADDPYLENRTVGWSEITPPPTGFGSNGGLAVDSSLGEAILFGGVTGTGLVNSTYIYNETANNWQNVSGAAAPSPRSDFAFAFDPVLRVGALFGGLTNLTSLVSSNQTWEVAPTGAWQPVATRVAPPAREGAAFAVAPSLGIGLLYGGWNRSYSPTSSVTYSDLWELNLTNWTWTELSVSGAHPPPLEGASMSWDPVTLRFEMFGGCYPCTSAVWEFDPGTGAWSELPTPVAAPAGRGYASWAYDPALNADLLFGGTGGSGSDNDTYLFFPSNDTWSLQTLPPHPSGRYGADAGFLDVPGNATWLLAGGLTGGPTDSDLWRLSTTSNVSMLVVNASAPSSPLEGTRVVDNGTSLGTTNRLGYLNLTQANGIDQPLVFSNRPWFSPRNITLWAPPGESIDLTVALTPEPLGTVNVQVVTSTDVAVPSAEVDLSVDGVPINSVPHLTDGSGSTVFHGVPPGSANVTATLANWRSGYAVGALAPGGVLNETLLLAPDPVLTVLVLGSPPGGGNPVPLDGATVILAGVDVGNTNATGKLSVVTAAFGYTSIVAEAEDFYGGDGVVNVPWTGTVGYTFTLGLLALGLLDVTVENENTSAPVPSATVSAATVAPLGWGPYSAANVTNFFGFTQLPLPGGDYSLEATATGYYPSPSTGVVAILPGGITSVVIPLQPVPPAKIHVLVQDATTRRPIDGAAVVILGVTVGVTDARGFFNVSDLTPALYAVECTATGYLENLTYVTLEPSENLTLTVNMTRLPLTIGGGVSAWSFNLFPGGLGDLWPFLAAPLFLVLGGFLYISVRRSPATEDRARTSATRGPGNTGESTEVPGPPSATPPPPST